MVWEMINGVFNFAMSVGSVLGLSVLLVSWYEFFEELVVKARH